MIKIILIYLLFAGFYVDQVLGISTELYQIKGLSVFNMILYALLIVWLTDIIKGNNKAIFQTNNLNIPILLMAYMMVFSIFVKLLMDEIPNISLVSEAVRLKRWFNPILLFLILFNVLNDKKSCNQVLFGLAILITTLLVTQLSGIFGLTDFGAETIEKFGRSGVYGESGEGEYAISIVLFVSLFLSGCLFERKWSWIHAGYIFVTFLSMMAIVTTGSRNGYITFIVSIIVYSILMVKNKILGSFSVLVVLLFVGIVGASTFMLVPSYLQETVIERFDPRQAEDVTKFTSGRTQVVENGWKLFLQSPVWGHGTGTFSRLSKINEFDRAFAAHNEYLRHLAEMGIVGFLSFILILYCILNHIYIALKTTERSWERLLYLSFIAGYCGFLVGMLATNTGPSLYIFWIFTGVVYKYVQLERKENITYAI